MSKHGFTLIELLIVVSIIGMLATVILTSISSIRNRVYLTRAQKEFRVFEEAMTMYLIDNNNYPPDVDRGIPSGLEPYISGTSWPAGPWPGSVYDWDNITGSDPYVQIGLRFCDIG